MTAQTALVTTQNTPDMRAIDLAPLSDRTKAQYKRALIRFIDKGLSVFSADDLIGHATTIPASERSFLKAAIKLLVKDKEMALKGSATPANVVAIQAAVYRFEAVNDAIKVKASTGTRAHRWLTPLQVKELTATCSDRTMIGRRDFVVLGLMLAAGLRREEVVSIRFCDVISQGDRRVLNVTGKGDKSRVIPINKVLASRIDVWFLETDSSDDDLIARSIDKGGRLGDSLSGQGVLDIVRKHGQMIGIDDLDPHDLRRSFAQIGYENGVPLTQVSKLLGHADIKTTQRYLNSELDLSVTASDFIPL